MVMYNEIELVLDTSVDDILKVLERDTKRIRDYLIADLRLKYSSVRNGNSLTIYAMTFKGEECFDDPPGRPVVRYEVFRNKKGVSTIKCSHSDEPIHEKICYLYLARLGVSVNAGWAEEINRYYRDTYLQEAQTKRTQKGLPKKKREIKLPSRVGDAYKWVLLWEILEPKLAEDPTLAGDYSQLCAYLIARFDWIPKEPTMKDIISLGRNGGIPDRVDFEGENRL